MVKDCSVDTLFFPFNCIQQRQSAAYRALHLPGILQSASKHVSSLHHGNQRRSKVSDIDGCRERSLLLSLFQNGGEFAFRSGKEGGERTRSEEHTSELQ